MPGEGELFVIGGAAVYELFLPRARRMYLTHVDAVYRGDTCFPTVDWKQWRAVKEERGRSGPAGAPAHRFVDYERIPS